MRKVMLALLLGVCVFAAARMLRLFFVPDILPVASEERAQPLWAFETAFVLKSVENVGLGVTVLSLIFGIATFFRARSRAGD